MKEHWYRLAFVLALILGLALAPLAAAQGGIVSVDRVDSSSYPNFVVLLSAQDANGVPVPDLEGGAFEIVEDGRASFPPGQVATQIDPDAVTSIALVVDLSGSMQGKPLEEAQSASSRLLDALLDRENDPDRVAFFGINRPVKPDDTAYDEAVEVQFGNDKNKVLNVVNFLTVDDRNRPTPLFDALFRVVKFTSEQGGRRAIIVITDGIDRTSQLEADDPIAEANRYNIPIFPISLSTNAVDETYLQRLAVRTGGEYRKAPTPEEFSDLFQQVLDQMKLQYKLDYQTTLPEDGAAHSVLVRVSSPRVQGFDEAKFVLGQAPVLSGTDTPAPPTVRPETPTPGVSPTASQTPEDGGDDDNGKTGLAKIIDDMKQFIEENPVPALLIGLAGLLLIVLVVLLIAWLLRRRRAASAAGAGYGFDAGGFEWQAGSTSSPTPGGEPYAASSPGGVLPTVAAGTGASSPTALPTVGQTYPPGAAGPGPAPYPAAVPFAGQQPPAGGTVALQRLPKHVAMLIDRKDASKRYDLLATTDVGRAQGNTIVLSDATVSRQHARIRLEEDKFMLFDLGSANGTFVNGKRVETPVALAENDVVKFGELEFMFKQLS